MLKNLFMDTLSKLVDNLLMDNCLLNFFYLNNACTFLQNYKNTIVFHVMSMYTFIIINGKEILS